MIIPDRPVLLRRNPKVSDAIALTFDDGPCPTSTAKVLDLLGEHAVTASFFMIGERVRRHPDLAMRVLREGHQIGNHSDRHAAFRGLVPSFCLKEAERAERTFQSILGVAPRFYRPPKGLIHRRVVRELRRAGYFVTTWSRMPGDYFRWHTADRISRRLARVRPGEIVVLHDGIGLRPGPDRSRTLSVLPDFIKGMKDRGFRFLSVADLLGFPLYFSVPAAGSDGHARGTGGARQGGLAP